MSNVEGVEFRQFLPSDLEQVKQLHEVALRATNAFGDSGKWDSDLDNIQGSYIDNGGNFIVGILENQVVAMGAFRRISATMAEIKRMRVQPGIQGRGIGRRLLNILETEIRERGYTVIELDTTVNQYAAQRLYESSGYDVVRHETEGWPLEMIFYQKSLA